MFSEPAKTVNRLISQDPFTAATYANYVGKRVDSAVYASTCFRLVFPSIITQVRPLPIQMPHAPLTDYQSINPDA